MGLVGEWRKRRKKKVWEKNNPNVSVGRHTYGVQTSTVFKAAKDAQLRVGAFCSIAADVAFLCDALRDTSAATQFPMHKVLTGTPMKKPRRLGITIGNDVWIGRSAIIMPGVKVGDGAAIGAGAIVTKDVPAYAIVAGSPARLIRSRFLPHQIEQLQKIRWWDWSDEKLTAEIEYLTGPLDEFLARHGRPSEKPPETTRMRSPQPVA